MNWFCDSSSEVLISYSINHESSVKCREELSGYLHKTREEHFSCPEAHDFGLRRFFQGHTWYGEGIRWKAVITGLNRLEPDITGYNRIFPGFKGGSLGGIFGRGVSGRFLGVPPSPWGTTPAGSCMDGDFLWIRGPGTGMAFFGEARASSAAATVFFPWIPNEAGRGDRRGSLSLCK